MSTTETESLLLTYEDVAKLLRCSVRTVHRLRKNGDLKPTKVCDGLVKFHRTEVERYASVGSTSSNTEQS